MADLAILFRAEGDGGFFDLMIEDGDLLGDEGLTTPVTISLFSDRLARADDPLPEYLPGQRGDRRGWWGDLTRDDGRAAPIGSRLWLLSREKTLPETVARAREYSQECLAWLPAEGGAFSAEAADAGRGRLKIDIAADRPGPEPRSQRWTAFLDYSQGWRIHLAGGF